MMTQETKILKVKSDFTPPTENVTLGELFFNKAEQHGDKICQIDGDLGESETYRSVKQRSVRLAISVKKLGITSEDVILFCSYNSLDNPIALIGCLYLGAKVVSLDPTLSARNSEYLLGVVKPTMVFVETESLSKIENALNGVKLNSQIVVFGQSEKYTTFSDLVQPSFEEKEFTPAKVNQHDIAIMFFSSGTTGMPKAICHSHYSLLYYSYVYRDLIRDVIQCILHYTTFYWISGMGFLILTFMEGTTRVFARTVDGPHIFSMIEKFQITSTFIAPIYTYELTKVPNPEKYNLTSFRALMTGGTSISTQQVQRLFKLFKHSDILNGYGISECGVVSTFVSSDSKEFIKSKIKSVGKVAPTVSIKVVNPENDEILGVNEIGEIRIKSQAAMKGYLGIDSSSSFDSDGFFKTGDLGHYDQDNCVYVDGRLKEMFKYLSWHIVPATIEAVILEHPAVKEAAVFGLPKEEEGEIPAACVVFFENKKVDTEELLRFVEERVSDKEKLRGGILVVTSLAKTPTGKLIRQKAKNMFLKSMESTDKL